MMLPLIVIGADEAVRAALEPYAQVGHIEYHPTAEDAHWALADAALEIEVAAPEDQVWPVHVAYGPLAYGSLVVGGNRFSRLEHGGHTLVLGFDVDPDPGKTIRVVGGKPVKEVGDTSVWQAGVAVAADRILDLAQPDAVAHLVAYLEWKSPCSR